MNALPADWRHLSCGLLLSLAGCAAQQVVTDRPTGKASWTMEAPAASQRYSLATGDTATGANLARTVTPVYPSGQLSACPPAQDVQALLIVDKLGKVSEVRVAGEAQAGPLRRPFILATRAAVTQWHFNPLQVQHDGVDDEGDPVVISEIRPFSLSYDFRFECAGGKPVVSVNQGATH